MAARGLFCFVSCVVVGTREARLRDQLAAYQKRVESAEAASEQHGAAAAAARDAVATELAEARERSR